MTHAMPLSSRPKIRLARQARPRVHMAVVQKPPRVLSILPGAAIASRAAVNALASEEAAKTSEINAEASNQSALAAADAAAADAVAEVADIVAAHLAASEAAKLAAEAAQAASEAAQTAAEAAQAAAEAEAVAAAASAAAALASENAAQSSEDDAETAQVAAEAAAMFAAGAATAADGSADAAAASAVAADASADAAAASAVAADASADAAALSAASLSMPVIAPGDAGKALVVNGTSDAYEIANVKSDAIDTTGQTNKFHVKSDWDAVGTDDEILNKPTLGTMAAQAASGVAITGGSITGITDLAIADGGTGAGTAAAAFTNLKQAATTTDTGVIEKATAAEIAAATADKFPDAAGVLSAMAFLAITAGASPAVDHALGVNRKITHSANATMGAPSNAKAGWPLNIWIVPGAFTTAWNAVYKFDGSTPTITAEGIACFMCLDSSNFVFLGFREKA